MLEAVAHCRADQTTLWPTAKNASTVSNDDVAPADVVQNAFTEAVRAPSQVDALPLTDVSDEFHEICAFAAERRFVST
nr:hypothetical protein [Rhodococcus sp. (in: high G+C Gram-positive bacteria)]